MPDPILDEIRRVRDELIKEHGGWKGYFRYVQKLDRAHRLRGRKRKTTKARQRKTSVASKRS
jgi:hypothetical protein